MDGLIQIPNSPNFGPYVSPYAFTGQDGRTGEPKLTELAKSFMPLEGRTSLSELFPDENIMERIVLIQQSFSTGDTIFPIVEMGKPDVVLGHNYGTTRQFFVQPLYIRRSTFISYGEINTKLRPGTMNEKWSPEEQISMIVQGMVREHNLTWDVYRAMMLLGGINYTDPRSGIGAAVNSQIPAQNFWHYGVTAGYRGRNEANLFRTMTEFNDPNPATAGVPWTHPDADIVTCIQRFSRWFKETNKSKLTALYMSTEMKEVLMTNNQVKMVMGGLLGRPGVKSVNVGDDIASAGSQAYSIAMDSDGISEIAGIPIRTVDTVFRDPVDGVFKRIWPKNKVVAVAGADVNGAAEPLGRTQYCVSEESGGQPGLWTRTQTETQIPAAPGMYMQMGNAGMPYLKYPYRCAHLNVCDVEEMNTRLGVLGDLNYGSF